MKRRLVAIGDLNAADDVLIDILRGTKLVNQRLEWCGGSSELVQVGDIFNRGSGAARILTLLITLQRQAARAGGRVTLLLGNHEVMTALRNEAYCTEGEYLAFASAAERRAWPERVHRALRRLLKQRPRGVVLPLEPRLEAWRIEHVPGRAALRRELGPRGKLGRALRQLPVACVREDALFVHAGLLPLWAALGIEGLNELARADWAAGERGLWTLPKTSLFRSSSGPLWDRSLVKDDAKARRALTASLRLIGAKRMIVGHTPTAALANGIGGHIQVLGGGKLIAIDVGLRSGPDTPRTALLIEDGSGYEWTPERQRRLWR